MNHWLFVTAAYAVTVIPVLALVIVSYRAMRAAEVQADALSRRD